jgi:predicted GNAT family acetyltransferase
LLWSKVQQWSRQFRWTSHQNARSKMWLTKSKNLLFMDVSNSAATVDALKANTMVTKDCSDTVKLSVRARIIRKSTWSKFWSCKQLLGINTI